MPFRDIGAILKKAQEEKENQKKGKHTTEMCFHTSLPKIFSIVDLEYKYPLH